MTRYTVFYRHPRHGEGSYDIDRSDATAAGIEAVEMLAEDFADDGDEADDAALEEIREDFEVEVYAGEHLDPPSETPAWSR